MIIGLRKKTNKLKYIFNKNIKHIVVNINPYLIAADNIIINKRRYVLSNFPAITDGSGALDGGFLILDENDKNSLLNESENAKYFVRPYIGSNELINDIKRWCIWIEDENLETALNINAIAERIKKVKKFRENAGTRALTAISRPHKFAWINTPNKIQIVIPTVSSERRYYVPIDFKDSNTIVSNSASIVHDPQIYIFVIISSKMHMIWVRTVAGRLEERIRYTSAICYNTFPFPPITETPKELLTLRVHAILEERERHSEKTLAELYDPNKMPAGLREAHRQNDLAIEQIYRPEPFTSDEERLEWLFKLYEEMIVAEKLDATKSKKSKIAVEEGSPCWQKI